MINSLEFYQGVVFRKLIHIAEKDGIQVQQYPSKSNCTYIINKNIGIYIKYSSKRLSPWRFSFQKIHQDEMLEMSVLLEKFFLILVCGEDGIVSLSFDEVKQVLNEIHEEVEWISVERNPRQEYSIKGSDGALNYKIGMNDISLLLS